ncbi:hypothetical protein [Falsiroseomonas selenitidurans]|uniref:Uncharacterized protein n=1 Tax=Falsiroseomonas selenitidurans TaxID=2716335 RepID=A0ABX1E963_9PROT|nr:hypothetical protein [Falsiroseomonas selenitidurans]NKC31450.1 hypothetical protein [Falsiroseomonas selenitidurans]
MRLAHQQAHRRIWIAMALLLPLILGGALTLRLAAPPEEAPRRLAPP